jgi:hypothetical protein
MSLTSEEALVIEEAVREGDTGRITAAGGAEIGDGGGAEVFVVGESVEEEVIEEGREKS